MRGLLGVSLLLWAQQPPENTVVPFTVSDKERLIRLESQLQAHKEASQAQLNALQREMSSLQREVQDIRTRLDRLEERMDMQFYALLGAMIGIAGAIIGAIFWDRRKTLQPLEQKIAEIQKDTSRLQNLLYALHEYAKNHPDLAALLRQYGAL
jgi:DNA repair exonuclease SbcCD ATPase subunit